MLSSPLIGATATYPPTHAMTAAAAVAAPDLDEEDLGLLDDDDAPP